MAVPVGHSQVEITDKALDNLIETYCREAGVRNLQKHIERIYRKVRVASSTGRPLPLLRACSPTPELMHTLQLPRDGSALGPTISRLSSFSCCLCAEDREPA